MICPHCYVGIHEDWETHKVETRSRQNPTDVFFDNEKFDLFYLVKVMMLTCPECDELAIKLHMVEEICSNGVRGGQINHYHDAFIAFPPHSSSHPPAPDDVPEEQRNNYKEACEVLPVSPKASATLSRCILQMILMEQGYKNKNLATQIDDVLKEKDSEKSLPSALRLSINAVRNFGNFSAHPITDKTTLQIIEVEPEEAEWCLDLIFDLFDHYYVKPADAKRRKEELDIKLAAAGKPTSEIPF